MVEDGFDWMPPTATEEHRKVVSYQMKADTLVEGCWDASDARAESIYNMYKQYI